MIFNVTPTCRHRRASCARAHIGTRLRNAHVNAGCSLFIFPASVCTRTPVDFSYALYADKIPNQTPHHTQINPCKTHQTNCAHLNETFTIKFCCNKLLLLQSHDGSLFYIRVNIFYYRGQMAIHKKLMQFNRK